MGRGVAEIPWGLDILRGVPIQTTNTNLNMIKHHQTQMQNLNYNAPINVFPQRGAGGWVAAGIPKQSLSPGNLTDNFVAQGRDLRSYVSARKFRRNYV